MGRWLQRAGGRARLGFPCCCSGDLVSGHVKLKPQPAGGSRTYGRRLRGGHRSSEGANQGLAADLSSHQSWREQGWDQGNQRRQMEAIEEIWTGEGVLPVGGLVPGSCFGGVMPGL